MVAPSKKAALAAWGSGKDLFAPELAEIVTDETLTAEPLASPGIVIRRSRGTTAEQIAALPTDPRPKREIDKRDDNPLPVRRKVKPTIRPRVQKSASVRSPPASSVPPKPGTAALDAAEEALSHAHDHLRREIEALVKEEAALVKRRRALEQRQAEALASAQARRDEEQASYDAALKAWRAGVTSVDGERGKRPRVPVDDGRSGTAPARERLAFDTSGAEP